MIEVKLGVDDVNRAKGFVTRNESERSLASGQRFVVGRGEGLRESGKKSASLG